MNCAIGFPAVLLFLFGILFFKSPMPDTDRQLSFIPYYRHAQDGIIQMSVWLKETATR